MAYNHAGEFKIGLFVKTYIIEVAKSYPPLLYAIIDRIYREIRGILQAVESFFLDGNDNLSVFHQTGCGIMIMTGYTEYIQG
jgi:hypothetical protein